MRANLMKIPKKPAIVLDMTKRSSANVTEHEKKINLFLAITGPQTHKYLSLGNRNFDPVIIAALAYSCGIF